MSLTFEEFKTKQREYFLSDKAAVAAMQSNVYEDDEGNKHFYEGDMSCVYKTSDDRGCAIGCVIPRELYDPSWDENSGTAVVMLPTEVQKFIGMTIPTERYYQACQWVHDDVALSGVVKEGEHFGRAFLARMEEIETLSPGFFTTEYKGLRDLELNLC